MTIHQHATLEDTVYFWFGSNDTSGSGNDGVSAAADVRLAGAAAGAAPVLSPTPILLSHASFPAGAYEVAVAATAANGFAATNTYAVFCTLTVDSQNPTGFIGSFTLDPIVANATEIEGEDATTKLAAALSDIDLDHFIQVTAGSKEPTDGSYLDQVMHRSSSQTFDATTDSLEAIRDTLSSSVITTVAAVSGDAITVVPFTTWEFTISGLADLSDALANGIFFTVKEKASDIEAAAVLQVQEGIGLTILNGSGSVTANKAILTVAAGEDEITVHVNASQTSTTKQSALVWDIKKIITGAEDADQMATGAFNIAAEGITRTNTTS